MDDSLFDDFDVDALLDAQSSDDDGSDLPELERSLDDILNDNEFDEILGNSAARNPPRTDPPEILTNGHAAAVALQDEDEEEAVENSRSREDEWRKESAGEFGTSGSSADENALLSVPTAEGLRPLSSAGNACQSGRTLTPAHAEGAEIAGSKRIPGSPGAGRAFTKSPPVNLLPKIAKAKPSIRPGAAFAAAAAASRQSVSSFSLSSRFTQGSYTLENSSSPEENESKILELSKDSSSESSSGEHFAQEVENHEPLSKHLESEKASLYFPDSHDRLGSVDVPDVSNEEGGSGGIPWKSDDIHEGVATDLRENLEILQEQASCSDTSTKLPSEARQRESPPGHVSTTVPNDCSSGNALETHNCASASEFEADLEAEPQTTICLLSERTAQSDAIEAELSDAVSLNNWIEEAQEQMTTKTELTPNSQLQRARNLALKRNSIHAKSVQQAIDEVEAAEKNVDVEKADGALIEPELQLTALEVAEELERKTASSGLHWEEGAVAQPMRLEGIQRSAPAIGLLQLDSGGALSYALQSSTLRREHGVPQALAVHTNFIGIGLSKGAILVIPSKYSATRSADETDAKSFVLPLQGPEKSVSSMCFNQQGDLLLVGFSNGHLMLWDVLKGNVIKTLDKEHSVAVVHILFLGQDVPGARNFKAITSDSKGLTLLHTFTVLPVPVLRRYTVNTTCILDGQRTGIVLSISPLLPEDGSQGAGGSSSTPAGGSSVPINRSSVMGVVAVGDVGRKFLYDGAPASEESVGGLVVFVTQQVAIVVRLLPAVEVCARLPRPEGIREGAIPYTAWRRSKLKSGIVVSGPTGLSNTSSLESVVVSTQKETDGTESVRSPEDTIAEGLSMKINGDGVENCPSFAIAWDRKVLIYQLPKSELRFVAQWEVDSPVVGVAWLEEQMMVVATSKDQLCLFTNEGVEIERAVLGSEHGGMGAFIYHTHFINVYGNPEKAHHNALAVRGAALYLLGTNRLWRARLLPWKDRIKALENAGDWMGAFHIAMEIYDGRSQGVTGLPIGLEAMQEAIMPTLLALLSAYIDEAFAYLSLALGPSPSVPTMKITPEPVDKNKRSERQEGDISEKKEFVETAKQEMVVEAREQYARVGGVAIEFCVHIKKTEVLFENVFSKFESVGHRGTFLELLEPYILKDMLGGLAPEVMQALVQHYSSRGWLNRVEQCVLHMDIASLDFNQVVLVCRDHGLYSALIYLFTKGLDDFKSPLEELLAVAQNSSHRLQAQTYGYKLLVYLKYCFSGLAFPPGNGIISSSRLPKLRAELLGYLLDRMEVEVVSSENVAQILYPRLRYLLKLDTQATLLVLGAAFPEDGPLGVGNREWVYPLIGIESKQSDAKRHRDSKSVGYAVPTEEIMVEGFRLAQQSVDAVVHIVQSTVNVYNLESTEISSNDQWPSEKDFGDMLEFLAHFTAAKYAMVPSDLMSTILEHLTSPTTDLEMPEERKLVIQQHREDLMVALLKAVPKTHRDAEQTLQLAQNTGYWQVAALLYAQTCDYTAALDSYLKDVRRPQNPFTFIIQMLSSEGGLEGSNLPSFQEAVLSCLPELIQLSTLSTLFVVLKHFGSENQRILRALSPHPKLLFNYLKAVMNVHSNGLEYSQTELRKDMASKEHFTLGELFDRNQQLLLHGHNEIDLSVFDSQVPFADLLQHSGLEVTREMAETFVELLCQFEPKSVLGFLERYENYRLEHCLKLCQDYGITDAAAFLLERVGDVASALSLVLADVDMCMQQMDQALVHLGTSPSEKFQITAGDELFNLQEVVQAHSALNAAVTLCQRNTFRLEPQESELLWFRLLDRFVESLHGLKKQIKGSNFRKQHHSKGEPSYGTEERIPSRIVARSKLRGNDLISKLRRKVLVRFIGEIVNGMMGYVPLPVIMSKILEDHRGHEFGDFKATILDTLSAYGYEKTILGTAKQLIEDDAFQNISALKRGCTHAFTPIDFTCSVCEHPLDELGFGVKSRRANYPGRTDPTNLKLNEDQQSDSNRLEIRIFPCGHATHVSCADLDSGPETRKPSLTVVCPICAYKRKLVDLTWHGKDPGLLKVGSLEVRAGKAKQLDKIDHSKQESMYRTTAEVFGQSRLQLLKQLEKGTGLNELDPSLKLNLAPMFTQYDRHTLRSSSSSHVRGKARATSSKGESLLMSQRRLKPQIR